MTAASTQLESTPPTLTPIEIVNLQTGDRWLPDFTRLSWNARPAYPQIAPHDEN